MSISSAKEEAYLEQIVKNPSHLARYKNPTFKMCELAVQLNPFTLAYVPEEFKTNALCLSAVTKEGGTLEWVPLHIQDEKLNLAAVCQNGCALQYLSESERTPYLCEKAVQNDGTALRYVPKALLTKSLCFDAIHKTPESIKLVPEVFLSETLCLEAMNQSAECFIFVPEQKRTEKIWVAMLNSNEFDCQWNCLHEYLEWQFQPHHLYWKSVRSPCSGRLPQTPKIQQAILSKHPELLPYLEETLPEQDAYAVSINGQVLGLIPEVYRTLELCHLAVNQTPDALQYVPEPLKSRYFKLH